MELLIGDSPEATHHPRIMRARETFIEWGALADLLEKLDASLLDGDRQHSLQLLSALVPEFVGEQSQLRLTAS